MGAGLVLPKDDEFCVSAQGEAPTAQRTQWREDRAKSVITKNDSPDLHFDTSINPYRGCEHGCSYCFARPHTYLGHSAGLDFERLLYAKLDASSFLRRELANPRYTCTPIAILFPEWLEEHYLLRKERVLRAIRSLRNGGLTKSDFTSRFIGTGPRAELIQQRFKNACKRYGISSGREVFSMDTSSFKKPHIEMDSVQTVKTSPQLSLFS